MMSRRSRWCSTASGKCSVDRPGKIAAQLAAEIGIVRHVRLQQFVVERELGVGQQHRQLRPRERLRAPSPLGDLHIVGKELDRAIELAGGFQRLHQALLEAEVLQPAPLGKRDRERLQIIVAQDQRRHLVGHGGEEGIAPLARDPAVPHRRRQCDLEIDLDVGGIHARRVVDGVGVESDAAQRRLDAAELRHAEIGALPDHLGADISPGDADRIIGAIAHRIVGLGRCPHIGADAAEEKQIDRRLQDRLDHLLQASPWPSSNPAPRAPPPRARSPSARAGTRRRPWR